MIRFHLHVVVVQFQRLGLLRHTCHTVLQCGPPPSGGGQTGWGTDGGHPIGTPEDVRQSQLFNVFINQIAHLIEDGLN